MSAKAPAKGHAAKHTAASKNNAKHATSTAKSGTKHTPAKTQKPVTSKAKGPAKVHATAAHAKPAKPAGFAIGDLLPVCSFEAVAMSARLLGARIHDDDVGELWHLLGEPAGGVPVGDALAAAVRFGLGSLGPGRVRPVRLPPFSAAAVRPGYHQVYSAVQAPQLPLILHVDAPGPHAVLATADGWWSWGELYSPWPCRVSEAWAVSWS